MKNKIVLVYLLMCCTLAVPLTAQAASDTTVSEAVELEVAADVSGGNAVENPVLPQTVGAQDAPAVQTSEETFTVGDWTYKTITGGASITGYSGSDATITLPTTVTYNNKTYKVRSVDMLVFADNETLEYLTIPAQITSLGYRAFDRCVNLKQITFQGDITVGSDCAFRGAGVNGDGVEVIFEDGVTTIPEELFYGGDKNSYLYANIVKVQMSDTVTSIGRGAFNNCYYLTDFHLSDKLTFIGEYAFQNCESLTNLDFPETLTEISGGAYSGCTGLKEIKINSDVNEYSWGSSGRFNGAGANSGGIKVIFSEGVTKVGENLFYGGDKEAGRYAHITEVVLPDTVTSISGRAFQNCYDLKEITLSNKLAEIYYDAFNGCTSLNNIIFPETLGSIGDGAFAGCTSLNRIVLPENMVHLGDGAFRDCSNLAYIEIQGNVERFWNSTTIDGYRDYACFSGAGSGQEKLEVVFGPKVTIVPAYLFATGAGKTDNTHAFITDVTVPDSVTEIQAGAFYNCYSLKNIKIGNNVKKVGDAAFYDCVALTEVELANRTAEIGDSAFFNCSGLKDIYISKSAQTLGKDIFAGCNDLIMHAPRNSVAAQYAKDNNITLVETTAVEDVFSDVEDGAWYVPSVQYVYDNKLMTGKGDRFGTYDNLTRSEFVTTLYSRAGKPAVTYRPIFKDVEEGAWYAAPIMWAYENGIVSGYADGNFGVYDMISREQLALMMYKYAELQQYDTSYENGTLSAFSDGKQVSTWAQNAVQWAVTHGIMSGKGKGSDGKTILDPQGKATRAECATMLWKFFSIQE